MLKLITGDLYDITELFNSNEKIILLVKIKSPDYNKKFLNYRTDLLKLYNDKYKELNTKITLIIDIEVIKKHLFKMMKNEMDYFKKNKNLLEFIVESINIIKDKSILKTIYKLLSPFMFKSNIEIFIKKNLQNCLKDILD
jgi:hypothetical protein